MERLFVLSVCFIIFTRKRSNRVSLLRYWVRHLAFERCANYLLYFRARAVFESSFCLISPIFGCQSANCRVFAARDASVPPLTAGSDRHQPGHSRQFLGHSQIAGLLFLVGKIPIRKFEFPASGSSKHSNSFPRTPFWRKGISEEASQMFCESEY